MLNLGLAILIGGLMQAQDFVRTPAAHVQVIAGTCSGESRLAEGPADSDLSQRRSQFFCDSAVVSFQKITDGRMMVQFAQKERVTQSIIGFAGTIVGDDLFEVDTVYINEQPIVAQEGLCKLFYNDQLAVTGIACGARSEESGRITVPVIAFDARQ